MTDSDSLAHADSPVLAGSIIVRGICTAISMVLVDWFDIDDDNLRAMLILDMLLMPVLLMGATVPVIGVDGIALKALILGIVGVPLAVPALLSLNTSVPLLIDFVRWTNVIIPLANCATFVFALLASCCGL